MVLITHQPADPRSHQPRKGRAEVAFPSPGSRLAHDVIRRFDLHFLREKGDGPDVRCR